MKAISYSRSPSIAYLCAVALVAPALLVSCGDDADDDTINVPPADAGRDRADAGRDRADAGRDRPDATTGAAVTEVACPGSVAMTIVMDDIAFIPNTAGVRTGDVVRWINNDVVPHTVTSGNPGEPGAGNLFDSETIQVGGDYCLRFDSPQAYDYFCEIHPVQMDDGRITVQ